MHCMLKSYSLLSIVITVTPYSLDTPAIEAYYILSTKKFY